MSNKEECPIFKVDDIDLGDSDQNKDHELVGILKRRINALKKIDYNFAKIKAQHFKDSYSLDCKYHNLYTPFFEKRAAIVKGEYDPTEEEADWPYEPETNLIEELERMIYAKGIDKNVRGITDFWLTIFMKVEVLRDMVQPHDAPILKHLIDIRLIIKEEPMSFILEFHFTPNEFFTNTVLTKEYLMKYDPDENPSKFKGPQLSKCLGCNINWAPNKNVTIKIVQRKQKNATSDQTVEKTVKNCSFFNFFTPPTMPEKSELEDGIKEELANYLTDDFKIGLLMKNRIIPRAVYFYTGEGIDDDFEEEEYDENEDEEKISESEVDKPNFNCTIL